DLERARRLPALLLLLEIELAEVQADDLAAAVTVDPLRALVPLGDVTVGTEHEDRIILHAVDEQAEAPLALRQRLGHLLELGDLALERGLGALAVLGLGAQHRVGLLERRRAALEQAL